MKHVKWQIVFAAALVLMAVSFYFLHYLIFRDSHHIFIYMMGDIAFVPIEVLLVTLIIHRLLEARTIRARLEKLNMVIGVFFSEVGTTLLTNFSDHDPALEHVRKNLIVTNDWSEQDFFDVSKRLKGYEYGVDIQRVDLEGLCGFLVGKRDFLVRLLENPTLFEHESFTEVLRAVFHLTEELSNREELTELPHQDYEHLAGDIKRAYILLVHQWLDYMKHLKDNYPYLFSLAMRMNPFDEDASPLVK